MRRQLGTALAAKRLIADARGAGTARGVVNAVEPLGTAVKLTIDPRGFCLFHSRRVTSGVAFCYEGKFPAVPYPVVEEPVALAITDTVQARPAIYTLFRPLSPESGSRSITEQPRSSTTWFTDTRPRLS